MDKNVKSPAVDCDDELQITDVRRHCVEALEADMDARVVHQLIKHFNLHADHSTLVLMV